MTFEKFTVKAREAIAESQRLAGKMGNPEIRPAHLLLALLDQDKGIVETVLQRMEVDPNLVRQGTAQLIEQLPQVSGGTKAGLSKPFNEVLEIAESEHVGFFKKGEGTNCFT